MPPHFQKNILQIFEDPSTIDNTFGENYLRLKSLMMATAESHQIKNINTIHATKDTFIHFNRTKNEFRLLILNSCTIFQSCDVIQYLPILEICVFLSPRLITDGNQGCTINSIPDNIGSDCSSKFQQHNQYKSF